MFLQRGALLFFKEHYFYYITCKAPLLALAAYEVVVDKPSNKLTVVFKLKSLRSHTSDGRQKIGVQIRFSVNTSVCVKWPHYSYSMLHVK